MLFPLEQNTPEFCVFEALNRELLYFLEHAVLVGLFTRQSLSDTALGLACWNNVKTPNIRGLLTRDKFEALHIALQQEPEAIRRQLFVSMRDNQDFTDLFQQRKHDLLAFIPQDLMKKLQALCYHLYTQTKTLDDIIASAGGVRIDEHFTEFKRINGTVCRACGLEPIAPFRANVADDNQWRADYDHLLCKSKYPIFAVHPRNLFPICRTCNQDAKKTKDMFFCNIARQQRHSFDPYIEGASQLVELDIELDDISPKVMLKLDSQDPILKSKLDTWNDVFEIKNLVEGRYMSLEHYVSDRIRPRDLQDLQHQVARGLAPPTANSLKRSAGVFWDHKLYLAMSRSNLELIFSIANFLDQEHGIPGGEFILAG
ncbi:hypothetical protein [Shewanella sp. SG41-3]|uniref:hypothetical protein n=1 Tax=Shewanella sp. SG41-3 TaxID=2760977 RepID=UPI0016004CB7|nr:hypothetical protein [Shewanella sp. SG41-3]MBB1475846.1 hypothetical protein [Shewanella sp. SG41-3]